MSAMTLKEFIIEISVKSRNAIRDLAGVDRASDKAGASLQGVGDAARRMAPAVQSAARKAARAVNQNASAWDRLRAAALKAREVTIKSVSPPTAGPSASVGDGGGGGFVGAAVGLAATITGVKVIANYEDAMVRLRIASNATADELKKMDDLAVKLGNDTRFSQSDVALGMEELAKNGLSAQQILGGAAKSAVALAASTGATIPDAASMMTDAMNQFGLKASDLGGKVNFITGAINQSKLSARDFAYGLSQGGGAAASAGVSFDEYATALAGISPMFASGQDAGTSFKALLTGLAEKSDESAKAMSKLGLNFYDAQGNLLPMVDIIAELQKEIGGLSEKEKTQALDKVFGSDGMRAAIGLMRLSGGEYEKLQKRIGSTDADKQAQDRMNTLAGRFEQTKGSVENLFIALGEAGIKGALKGLLEAVTPIIQAVADWIKRNPELTKQILGFIAVFAGTFFGLKMLVQGFTMVRTALGLLKVAAATNPLILLVAAIAAAAYLIYTNWDLIKQKFNEGVAWLKGIGSKLYSIGANLMQGIVNGIANGARWVYDKILEVSNAVKNKFKEFFGIHSPSRVFFGFGGHMTDGLVNGLKAGLPAIRSAMDKVNASADIRALATNGFGYAPLPTPQTNPGPSMVARGGGTTINVGPTTVQVQGGPSPQATGRAAAAGFMSARGALLASVG